MRALGWRSTLVESLLVKQNLLPFDSMRLQVPVMVKGGVGRTMESPCCSPASLSQPTAWSRASQSNTEDAKAALHRFYKGPAKPIEVPKFSYIRITECELGIVVFASWYGEWCGDNPCLTEWSFVCYGGWNFVSDPRFQESRLHQSHHHCAFRTENVSKL